MSKVERALPTRSNPAAVKAQTMISYGQDSKKTAQSALVQQRVLAHPPQLHIFGRQRLRLLDRVRDARLRRKVQGQMYASLACGYGDLLGTTRGF